MGSIDVGSGWEIGNNMEVLMVDGGMVFDLGLFRQDWVRSDEMGSNTGSFVLEVCVVVGGFGRVEIDGDEVVSVLFHLVGTSFGG